MVNLEINDINLFFENNNSNSLFIRTMPHCVLTLRLIGLAFDIADGTLPEEKMSKDMKRLAIKPQDRPDFLEVATFTVSALITGSSSTYTFFFVVFPSIIFGRTTIQHGTPP